MAKIPFNPHGRGHLRSACFLASSPDVVVLQGQSSTTYGNRTMCNVSSTYYYDSITYGLYVIGLLRAYLRSARFRMLWAFLCRISAPIRVNAGE